jgi:hypothetical protein
VSTPLEGAFCYSYRQVAFIPDMILHL